MRGLLATVIALACVATLAIGQEPGKQTDEERLRLRVLQLETAVEEAEAKANSCFSQVGLLGQYRAAFRSQQLTADQAELTRWMEERHKGFSYNPKTGELSKKPDPPSTPPPAGK